MPQVSRSNFFEAEILIGLCARGRTVREIDIPHRPRIAGYAKGVTPADALLALRDVLGFTVAWWFRRPVPVSPPAAPQRKPTHLPVPDDL